MRFSELVKEFGRPELISHDKLYGFVNNSEVRSSLVDHVYCPKCHVELIDGVCANSKTKGINCVYTATPLKEHAPELWEEVRRRSKAELFWLARFMLWETMPDGAGKDISESLFTLESHNELVNFFIKKDEHKSIAEQDWRKDRMILWPRGGFKSTTDVADVVQWILNFPDIRILFLTAADDLAIGFVAETSGHFLKREEHPSLMNIFFSDYCVSEKVKDDMYSFNCPLWTAKRLERKEPTVTASSITSTLSGFHYEVIKADDTVSNKNSENEDQCDKVTRNFYVNRKMLMPFGYCDMIGTRYHEIDLWGKTLEQNVGEITRTKIGTNIEIIDNLSTGQRILIGKDIVIKPERILELEKEQKKVNYVTAGEDGCWLLMPNHHPYSWLMREWKKDEPSFEGQLQQNPTSITNTVFPRELLIRNTVDHTKMPFRGPVSQTWDFAYSKKKGRDYSTASSVIWDNQGRFFVHDLIRARFTPTDLAKAVVEFAQKHRPFVIGVENSIGSRYLESSIKDEAKKTGDPYIIALCGRIDWIQPDNQKDAKRIRMSSLHPWLTAGRMQFASYIPILDVVYSEFEKCMVSHHHDDLPDVLAQQIRYAPQTAQIIAKNDFYRFSNISIGPNCPPQMAWNMIFEENCDAWGRPGMGEPVPLVNVSPEPEIQRGEAPDGLDPILGAGLFG